MEAQLYRSRRDRLIAGVCGGLAARYGWDPTLVRLAAVGLALITSGGAVIAYVLMAVLIPEEPGEGYVQGSPFTIPPYQHLGSRQPFSPSDTPQAPGEQAYPGGTEGAGPREGEGPTAPPPPAPAPAPSAVPTGPGPSAAPTAPGPARPMPPSEPHPSGRGGIIIGAILVVVGGLLLADRFLVFGIERLWPLIIIVIGLAIMFGRGGRDR